MHYVRGSNIREYLTTTLKSSVVSIQNCTEELEVNYLTVYKILIKEEESSSGKKSSKKAEISLEEAKSDPDVFARVKHNQTVLQGFVESVLNDIIKSQEQMPYGVRYISKLLYHALSKKFPKENKDDILKIVGSLIYYRYMNPALVSPDAFDVTYTTVSQLARKNLMEVSKLLYAICVDKNLPEGMEIDLEYKKKATTSFFEYLLQIIEVPKPEIQFNYDTFRDVARTHNPIIYISSDEIYSLHETLYNLKDTVCSSPEDPLRKLLDALGEPPSSTQTNEGHEIALTLTPVYAATHIHEDSESQHVFFLTKKAIVKLIRVYTNKRNLIDILNSPTTSQDEEIYQIQNASASPLSTSNLRLESNESLYKVNESSLQLLKENVRQMLVYLEKAGLVTEKDGYECILRSIATDIRNKYDRNDAIRREKENLERTLKILREKNEYLQLQEKSYLEYVDACTLQFSTSTVHPVKKRGSFFSFSRQARQMRQVEKKKGASPKSLTYTYSAQELLEKGIISWIDPELVPSSVLEKLEITLSSATAGVFEIKASLGVHSGIKSLDNHLSIKELDTFRLDELLSLQFENKQEISLFDGSVKGNHASPFV
ncbi:hypothetical protein HMI54_014421 [Coelomomyces lativittatus]|nr:hypothetical protein HMI54_014421 [Coelomomyces lativittatus]